MKIFVCLLALVCVCNASFLNLLGGKSNGGSHVTYNVVATPTHAGGGHGHSYHGHGHDGSTQVIKVIFDHSSANHGGGYASGHSYKTYGHGHGHSTGGEVQIFKVFTENAPANGHIEHSYSGGSSGGWSSASSSYASGYGHGGPNSVNSYLGAILPNILQLILQDDADHGGDINSQIIANFGHKGNAIVTRLDDKKPNSFYSSGHVIQKGVLKVTKVEGKPTITPPFPVKVVHAAPPPASHSQWW